ncbi:6-pyruvoyl tetrahydropterin synthase [Pseudobythopirellula maris]|uniref:6-carboxy-5,6,7,8-tetrahydropterin synthase n=1 Tax=Pseudobythopirellula maris TaxID=2527991 RepID=A0A5C5ZN52_9BACT|nr:6-pyruvoyl tetrahydropterin synthase family protein [Pseudobythopirellula maris]TWT88271.1 6-pyruvoyl tetrahydropterin synthase [Pseudobythopirellula maris]
MGKHYRVRVEKDSFVFSAAHFITYNGGVCEPLHGHNYGVAVEATGPLDENHYVVDFIALRDATLEVTRRLDHRALLPTEHPAIRVTESPHEVEARFEERRWVFPAEDCVLLPVANTTAELLARWIGERLLERLAEGGVAAPAELTVTVDECAGQAAECRLTPNE